MLRTSTFQLRVTDEERRVFKAVADRLQRDESDTIRLLVRNVAQELGVTPSQQPAHTTDDQKAA